MKQFLEQLKIKNNSGYLKGRAVVIAVVLIFALLMGGCENIPGQTVNSAGTSAAGSSSGAAQNTIPLQNVSITEKIKDADTDSVWDAAASTAIALNGDSAVVSGSGAKVSGGTVTITAAGTYVVSGTLAKGQIVVEAGGNDLVRLVLNGVNITAGKNAAIYAATADKLVVILADGTGNTLTDVSSYTYANAEKEEPDAALFSKCDLTVNGSGILTVNANFKHGIATKDDLIIAGGNITVHSVSTAIRGKDSVTVLGGAFRLTSQNGDGIKSANNTEADKGWILIKDGTFTITAYNDGIQAATALQIDDGTFEISTGGGWPGGSLQQSSHGGNGTGFVTPTNPSDGSYKGIKSNGDMVIGGGTLVVRSYDDSVHSGASISITGGELTLQSGDDGIHADIGLTVGGGKITVSNCYEGIEASAINISSGEIDIQQATDDGINASGESSPQINISGGVVKALASSDCLDSNATVSISGGTVYLLSNATRDGDALDSERTVTVTGGTVVYGGLISTGSKPSEGSTQSYVYTGSNIPSGSEITVKKDGKTLIAFSAYSELRVLALSSPDIISGQSYEIYSGSTLLATATAGTGGGGMNGRGGGMGDPRGGQGGSKAPGGRV